MSDSLRFHELASLCIGFPKSRILEWVSIPFSGDLPNPVIKPGSLAWQTDCLPQSHLESRLDWSPDIEAHRYA